MALQSRKKYNIAEKLLAILGDFKEVKAWAASQPSSGQIRRNPNGLLRLPSG